MSVNLIFQKLCCDILSVSLSFMFQEKLEISCGLADKKGSWYLGIMKNLWDKCIKNFANLYESFGNEAFVCLSSEYDMSKKERFHIHQDFCQWKIQHLSLKKKSCHMRSIWREFKNEIIYLLILELFYMLINQSVSLG